MRLDLPTLFWVLNLAYAANLVFSLILYRFAGSFPGARLWILAQGLAALGSLLFAERAALPYPGLVAANTLFVAAVLCYAHAAWAYRRERPFPRGLYAILPALALALAASSGTSINFRNILVSLTMGGLGAWAAAILLRGIPKPLRFAARMTALPFGLVAFGNLAQILLSLSRPAARSFEALGEGHALVYLLAIAMASFSLLGFFLLATQRRQALLEEQGRRLEEANEELREADRTKDLFVSMLAHDLRGPISGAASYARKHLLPEDADLAAKRETLRVLVSSLERATSLLDDMLLWGRARNEKAGPRLEELELADLASSLIRLFGPALEAKAIGVRTRLEAVRVLAERDAAEIVLRNMMSNALKFSPPGGEIEVETGREGGRAYLLVADRGPGIGPELRARLFRMDARVTTPGSQGEKGSGLGLILCAEYAARMGASFGIDEREGGGSLARLVFPGPGEEKSAP